MSGFETFQKLADELLRRATATHDLAERSRLITAAAHWHMKAAEVHGSGHVSPPGQERTVLPFGDDGAEPEA